MRKSFYQMLQFIEGNVTNKYNKDNEIRQILNEIDPSEQQKIAVKVALYCAEDCYYQNNPDTEPLAKRCIQLTKMWLENDNYVERETLRRLSEEVGQTILRLSLNNQSTSSISSLNAANCSINAILYDPINSCSLAITNASNAHFYASKRNNDLRKQKINQYKNYLLTLISQIEFDNENDKELLVRDLQNRYHPENWTSNDWFNFLNMLQNEKSIPIVIEINNNDWMINPNFGNYDIHNENPLQLINIIATNSEFKDFRTQLYNKIL